eukprot:2707561-Amphidinium_carterae.1
MDPSACKPVRHQRGDDLSSARNRTCSSRRCPGLFQVSSTLAGSLVSTMSHKCAERSPSVTNLQKSTVSARGQKQTKTKDGRLCNLHQTPGMKSSSRHCSYVTELQTSDT